MSLEFGMALPYLLGILGLLLLWQLFQIQVATGRVQAVNFWDRSGVRMFVHVTPDDEQVCPACREAHGLVLMTSVAGTKNKKKYSPLRTPCTNPAGCRCQLIGLYGGSPEGQRLRWQATISSTQTVKVSGEKLAALLKGQWEKAPNGKADRVSMHMLGGMLSETSDPMNALNMYQVVAEQAKSARDLPFIIPAYLRMTELYERLQQPEDALNAIQSLERKLSNKGLPPGLISRDEEELLSLKKTRLSVASSRPI